MALLLTRAEELEELTSEGSHMVVYRLGASTLVTQASGRPGVEHIQLLMRRSDDLIARAGHIDIVHDWFQVTGYDPEIRRRMTPWAVATRKQHRGIHIGTNAGLVRMGVTMVRLAAGAPIHAYESLIGLEVALAGILGR